MPTVRRKDCRAYAWRPLFFGSLNRLMAELRERGIVTKVRSLKSRRMVGGIPFTRGPLAHLLRNRFYIGEVALKGEVLPGGFFETAAAESDRSVSSKVAVACFQ
jgi:site-specific DNA recombinase